MSLLGPNTINNIMGEKILYVYVHIHIAMRWLDVASFFPTSMVTGSCTCWPVSDQSLTPAQPVLPWSLQCSGAWLGQSRYNLETQWRSNPWRQGPLGRWNIENKTQSPRSSGGWLKGHPWFLRGLWVFSPRCPQVGALISSWLLHLCFLQLAVFVFLCLPHCTPWLHSQTISFFSTL